MRAPIFAHSSSPGGRYHHSSGRAARWNDQVIHPPPPGNLVNLNECQNGVNHGPPAQVHFHGLSMGDFCYEFPLIFGEIAGEARKGLPFHLCGVLRACVLLFSHTQAHAALRWLASCLHRHFRDLHSLGKLDIGEIGRYQGSDVSHAGVI